MIKVYKRNGFVEDFNSDKIKNAIRKTLSDDGKTVLVNEDVVNLVYDNIDAINYSEKDGTIMLDIEKIQDSIENAFMNLNMFEEAKRFILYRSLHKETRENAKKIDFMDKYMKSENAASGSKYDQNANVSNKNIATMVSEMDKGSHIRLNRKLMHTYIKKRYGNEFADKYLYLLNNHFIYKNDETSIYPYCASVSMYPWLLDGLKPLGGEASAPTNLRSFSGGFINLVFIMSSMLAGACSTPEYLLYTDYFIRKDYGDDYIKRLDEIVDMSNRKRTLKKEIEDSFEQVVFSINQPTGARSFQSVFWNIAYYDKYYFEGIFHDFRFPDGTEPIWETLEVLQQMFMNWFNNRRTKEILTYPVESFSLLYDKDTKEFKDKKAFDIVTDMYSKGHSFFTYVSDDVDSLSSCCFSPDTKVIIKEGSSVSIETLKNVYDKSDGENVTTFHNGAWVKAKPIRLPKEKFFKVTLVNGSSMCVSENHLNPVLVGNCETLKKTKELNKNSYVLFNTTGLPSDGDNCSFVQEGFDKGDEALKDNPIDITASLYDYNYRKSLLIGLDEEEDNSCTVHDKETYESIVAYLTTMGLVPVTTHIDDSEEWRIEWIDRMDMPYTRFVNNSAYIRIKSIEYYEYDDQFMYCFEMANKTNPYFTLANGIITHNCRLKNKINNTGFSYTLGAGGVSTGSKGVMTINLNRCGQWAVANGRDPFEFIDEVVNDIHKFQIAYNDIITMFCNNKMLPMFDAGYINIDRQYLTLGINGLLEFAEFMGIDINYNDRYKDFANKILGICENANNKYHDEHHMFNTEMIPAESVGVKHSKWDKEDGYSVTRDCYNSYFYKVEDTTLTVFDKIKMHGNEFINKLSGGSACHLNLTEHLTKKQYEIIVNECAKKGCSYFTFNVPNTICNKCGHISKDYLNKCNMCGSEDLDYMTRIIGYLVRISKFSEGRKIEAKKRFYHKLV